MGYDLDAFRCPSLASRCTLQRIRITRSRRPGIGTSHTTRLAHVLPRRWGSCSRNSRLTWQEEKSTLTGNQINQTRNAQWSVMCTCRIAPLLMVEGGVVPFPRAVLTNAAIFTLIDWPSCAVSENRLALFCVDWPAVGQL